MLSDQMRFEDFSNTHERMKATLRVIPFLYEGITNQNLRFYCLTKALFSLLLALKLQVFFLQQHAEITQCLPSISPCKRER